ncbi:MAG: hypothetical protein WC516_00465 [Patescibacteria group bacterium]
MLTKIKAQSGQGLLELIIAIGVIAVGLFAVWTLFLSNFFNEQQSGNRIIAGNLAREGIEAVKNIRDSNWLKMDNNSSTVVWDSGLPAGQVVVTNLIAPLSSLDESIALVPLSVDNDKLYYDSTGYFNNLASATSSPYRRDITIKLICCHDGDSDLQCDDNQFEVQDSPTCQGTKLLKIGLDVESKVSWFLNNKIDQSVIHEQLFNWR